VFIGIRRRNSVLPSFRQALEFLQLGKATPQRAARTLVVVEPRRARSTASLNPAKPLVATTEECLIGFGSLRLVAPIRQFGEKMLFIIE
jgi:hypothetical protein